MDLMLHFSVQQLFTLCMSNVCFNFKSAKELAEAQSCLTYFSSACPLSCNLVLLKWVPLTLLLNRTYTPVYL